MLALDWTLDEPQGVSNPPHHRLSSAPNRGLQNELKPNGCRSLSGLSSILYLQLKEPSVCRKVEHDP